MDEDKLGNVGITIIILISFMASMFFFSLSPDPYEKGFQNKNIIGIMFLVATVLFLCIKKEFD